MTETISREQRAGLIGFLFGLGLALSIVAILGAFQAVGRAILSFGVQVILQVMGLFAIGLSLFMIWKDRANLIATLEIRGEPAAALVAAVCTVILLAFSSALGLTSISGFAGLTLVHWIFIGLVAAFGLVSLYFVIVTPRAERPFTLLLPGIAILSAAGAFVVWVATLV